MATWSWHVRVVLDIETHEWRRKHFEVFAQEMGPRYTARRDHGPYPGEAPDGLIVDITMPFAGAATALQEVLDRAVLVLGADPDADLLVQATLTRVVAPDTKKETHP